MAWNEPGGGKNDGKDPWGSDQGPPDLDDVFRNFQKKFKGFFGGGGGSGTGGSQSSQGGSASFSLSLLLVIVAVVYAGMGFYVIHPPEMGVVTRLGAYNRTVEPGLHWLPPIIEKKKVGDVRKIDSTSHKASMLTQDENIVDVEVIVQYRISDVEEFYFNVSSPVKSLKEATESAMRQVIGHSDLDSVITTGRAEIATRITEILQNTMGYYKAGLEVVDVAMQPAKYPAPVKPAFDDVIKAQEERVSTRNRAEAYANKILPDAEGRVQRLLEEAEAYKQEAILTAQGDTARFRLILPEYKIAPDITRKRLYLDTVEKVLSNTSKVLVDLDSGNNLVYLPIDRLMQNRELATNQQAGNDFDDSTLESAKEVLSRQRDVGRSISRVGRDYQRGRG